MSDSTIPENRSEACTSDMAIVTSTKRRECLSSAAGAAVTAVVAASFIVRPGTALAGCGVSSRPAKKVITAGYDEKFVISIFGDTGVVILGAAGAFTLTFVLTRNPLVSAGVAALVMIVGHKGFFDTNKKALEEELQSLRKKMGEL